MEGKIEELIKPLIVEEETKKLAEIKMIDLINSSLALKKYTKSWIRFKNFTRSASLSKKEIILSNFDIRDLNVNYFEKF